MFNTRPQATWAPFTIPATPSVSVKSIGGKFEAKDPYVVSAKSGADPRKNPSQFLEWSQLPINDILLQLEELKRRLDSASIDAQCANGTVTVTLNL
jgi:hypothetical protein